MPNWCNNKLIMTGTTEQIAPLRSILQNEEHWCESIMPTPPNLAEELYEDKKTWAKDIIAWRIKNRGSKWGVDVLDIRVMMDETFSEGRSGMLVLYYDTAGAPYVELTAFIAKTFGLEGVHGYISPNGDYCGTATFKDGELHDKEKDGLDFADLLEWGYADGYEPCEVREDGLLYLDNKAWAAIIENDRHDDGVITVLPIGGAQPEVLQKHENIPMIDEYVREEYCLLEHAGGEQ